MVQPTHEIAQLIVKRLQGTIGVAEDAALEAWAYTDAANLALLSALSDDTTRTRFLDEHAEDKQAVWKKVIGQLPELQVAVPMKPIRWWRYAIAAAVVVAIGSGVYYLGMNGAKPAPQNVATSGNDVPAPENNLATLTLADGKVITLDNTSSGQLARQGTVQIVKQQNGAIEYKASDAADVANEVAYNTINTRRGSRYKIVLSDHSIVWLNAASTLKYPIVFSGTERIVELTGEGYFEVAKQVHNGKRVPFHVIANNMKVEVLGTHFNIMSYAEEGDIKTTLLEGSVKVVAAQNAQLLSPGQQATVSRKSAPIVVNTADTEEAVAWKDELFMFNNVPIQTIMREIARSYDVEVEYLGAIPLEKFSIMGIPRHVPVSQLLKVLALTDKVNFSIEGRKITVKKK